MGSESSGLFASLHLGLALGWGSLLEDARCDSVLEELVIVCQACWPCLTVCALYVS